MTARYIIGDSLSVLKKLPNSSVDLVMTSPPFLALRSYLPADHPDKDKEMGSEASPGGFIDALLDIVEECDRVLAPHGSAAFELGDTYSGSGGSGGDYTDTGLRAGQEKFNGSAVQHRRSAVRNRDLSSWPMAKSLCMVPELFRIALAYGVNPLTGRQTDRWRVRNVVRWVRPNPPVGALGDKFRPATSEMVIACKSSKRYFDLDAVRVPANEANKRPSASSRKGIAGRTDQVCNPLGEDGQRIISNAAGAPPLDWWSISPTGYSGHYAVYPPELCIKPIKSMCPERVCTVCGEPSRRVVDIRYTDMPNRELRDDDARRYGSIDGKRHNDHRATQHTTTGWTECGHDSWRSGVVLDCFGGSGTTGLVSVGHGRNCVLIDLDERNAELAQQRIGMFLEVSYADDAQMLPNWLASPQTPGDVQRDAPL